MEEGTIENIILHSILCFDELNELYCKADNYRKYNKC